MAGLFAVDGSVDVDDTVLPLGKLGQFHRGAVRDLLIQAQQQLFPDDLGAHLPLRLVRDHVVGEELRPLGQERGEHIQQLFDPVSVFG